MTGSSTGPALNRDTEAQQIAHMESRGMTVDYFAPEEVIKMRTRMKPVIDKYSKAVGPEFVASVYAEVDRIVAAQQATPK